MLRQILSYVDVTKYNQNYCDEAKKSINCKSEIEAENFIRSKGFIKWTLKLVAVQITLNAIFFCNILFLQAIIRNSAKTCLLSIMKKKKRKKKKIYKKYSKTDGCSDIIIV